jgi:hypothetical protein
VLVFWVYFAFPLVVDICVPQPPIATLGETASTSQVLPKGVACSKINPPLGERANGDNKEQQS